MIKHQVEAMESGHSLPLLGDFQETCDSYLKTAPGEGVGQVLFFC